MRNTPAPAEPGRLVVGDEPAGLADPGERGAPAGPGATGRRRRRPTGPDLVAATVFAIAGAMFVAGATTSGGQDLRVDQTGGLRAAIASLSDENRGLQSDVDGLSARVTALQTSSAATSSALEETVDQIARLSPQVGLTEVRGPGVTVTLNDAPPPATLPEGFTGDDYLVHQEDVQGVVNALWRGGASAVSVMGQRLVATSAVRCVGNTVILHGRVYSPPFVIEGVGDVARMEASLATDPSVQFFREWAKEVGLGYTQQPSDELLIPAYTGPISPAYAQVVP